jgi:hypothetical protein
MNRIPKLLALAVVSSMSLAASSSRAQTADLAVDREGPSGGVLIGYGFDDAYKFGLGLRGGYTLAAPKVYIGGTFVYHFGQSQSDGDATVSEHLLYLGPEGGYDFVIPSVPQVLIRPYLGLGFESVSVSVSGNTAFGASASSSGFALWPGVTGLYSFTSALSAGLDARVVIAAFANSDASFVLSLTGQYKF